MIIPLDYQYIAGFYNLDILRAQDFNDDYHLINMSNKNLYIAKILKMEKYLIIVLNFLKRDSLFFQKGNQS